MKKVFAFCLCQFLLLGQVMADGRTVVKVPPEIREMFLEEMRGHLDNLNEITYAISAGDFAGAAYVAENKMGFGHSIREVLENKGVPDHEIEEFIQKLKDKYGDSDRSGQGMGRYMPAEFRELGQSLHRESEEFASVAKNVGPEPTVENYQQVFNALSEVVDVCSACHSTFTIK